MTYAQGLSRARRYRLGREFAFAYRDIKPWWAFWISEAEAVHMALAEWDLLPTDRPEPKTR